MHRISTGTRAAALTALVGIALATAAFAQFEGPPPGPPPPFGGPRFGGPGGGPGRGMRGPRPSTAANAPLPALAAGLKLTSVQQAEVAKIQAQFAQSRRMLMPPPPSPGGPPPDPGAMRAVWDQMRGMDQAADARIGAVLTGPQRAALPALLRTLDDLRLAGIPPATYGALKLTGSQTARITGLAQASQQEMRGAMDAARRSGDFGSVRQTMRAGRDRLASQAAAVLTPTQRSLVDKYKAAHPRPPFGGPGDGFGGPRGGPPPPFERRS